MEPRPQAGLPGDASSGSTGTEAVSYEPLVSGWLDEKSDEAWGRPVDVEVLDDGSLLVSDDAKGVLYRITYRG